MDCANNFRMFVKNILTMDKKVFIYILICPIDGKIKYIGQTINPEKRYGFHYSDIHSGGLDKLLWIYSLIKEKKFFVMKIIDVCEHKERVYWEKFYIDLFRSWGFDLFNRKCSYKFEETIRNGKKKEQYFQVICREREVNKWNRLEFKKQKEKLIKY